MKKLQKRIRNLKKTQNSNSNNLQPPRFFKLKNLNLFRIAIFFGFNLFLIAAFFLNYNAAYAVSPDELRAQINARLKELEELDRLIEKNQNALEETQKKRSTLENELKSLRYQLNQINFGIRASKVQIEKLFFEIESIEYDIETAQKEITVKKQAIVRLLRKLQENDRKSLLIALLEGRSLAESIMEVESIIGLHRELAIEVSRLSSLQKHLENQLALRTSKKIQKEREYRTLKTRKKLLFEKKEDISSLLVQTKSKEEQYQYQLQELRKQQNDISDAISRIEQELRANFDPDVLPAKRPGVFLWPVALKLDGGAGHITQHYGERSYLYRGKPHNGLDIGAPVGTPVYAADDGVVKAVDNNDRGRWRKYQYGKYVLIEHGTNLTTLYAHLSDNSVVKAGDRVKRGDLIGYVGSTGYSTGPHLHFGAYWAPSVFLKSIPPAAGLVPVGVTINPEDYL